MKKKSEHIENLFRSKEKFHQDMAQLPIEEKVKILVRLQKIHLAMMKARGEKIPPEKRVWKIPEEEK